MSTSQVRELALELPLEERARLARELIASLDPTSTDPDVEQAWIAEIDKRAEALDRGESKAYDGQTSLDEIRRRLRQEFQL